MKLDHSKSMQTLSLLAKMGQHFLTNFSCSPDTTLVSFQLKLYFLTSLSDYLILLSHILHTKLTANLKEKKGANFITWISILYNQKFQECSIIMLNLFTEKMNSFLLFLSLLFHILHQFQMNSNKKINRQIKSDKELKLPRVYSATDEDFKWPST